MKRMLDIDKAITNLISEVGYKIEVDEVEKIQTKMYLGI